MTKPQAKMLARIVELTAQFKHFADGVPAGMVHGRGQQVVAENLRDMGLIEIKGSGPMTQYSAK